MKVLQLNTLRLITIITNNLIRFCGGEVRRLPLLQKRTTDMREDYIIIKKADIDNLYGILRDMQETLSYLVERTKTKDYTNDWVESQEARKLLGISARTWQMYRDKRVIPFSQFGRKIYVKRTDIEEFLRKHQK